MNDDGRDAPDRRDFVKAAACLGGGLLSRDLFSIAAHADEAENGAGTEERQILKQWLDTFLSEQDGEGGCGRAFNACGRACADRHGMERVIAGVLEEAGPEASLDDKLALMDRRVFGGGCLTRSGDDITAVWPKCYCAIVARGWVENPRFCDCSAGWCKATFGRLLDREVEVDLIRTVLRGDDGCEIRISLG